MRQQYKKTSKIAILLLTKEIGRDLLVMEDNTIKNRFRHLTLVERGKISAYLDQGLKVTEIAKKLGCHRSTIYREIKRGTVTVIKQVHGIERDVAEYAPFAAQALYDKGRAKAKHRNLIDSNKISSDFLNALNKEMKKKLRKFSVETFVHHYKAKYPDVYVPCFKTIYRYIHQQLIKLKPIDMPRMVRYKARKVASSTCPHKKKLGNSIDLRPQQIEAREEFGHFEIDLVHGKQGASEPVILTLVERVSRFAVTRILEAATAEKTNAAIKQIFREIGARTIKSITADNGSEFARLTEFETTHRKIYFAHPYASYERGTNENFNGLLREFIPKGKSIHEVSKSQLKEYVEVLNSRPRPKLGYKSAEEVFRYKQQAR